MIRWTTDWPTFFSPGNPVPQYLPTVGRLRDEHTGKTDNKTSKLTPQKVKQISLWTILIVNFLYFFSQTGVETTESLAGICKVLSGNCLCFRIIVILFFE